MGETKEIDAPSARLEGVAVPPPVRLVPICPVRSDDRLRPSVPRKYQRSINAVRLDRSSTQQHLNGNE
jgi:hypothetical protein